MTERLLIGSVLLSGLLFYGVSWFVLLTEAA